MDITFRDYRQSKYPDVPFLKNHSIDSLRPVLKKCFSVHGIPNNIP